MHSPTADAAGSLTTIYRNRQASEIVVMAVAQAKGVDPLALEPLYDVVDPDALDAIFSSDASSSDVQVSFTMADCDVVVRGDGEIDVTPPEDPDGSLSITRLDE